LQISASKSKPKTILEASEARLRPILMTSLAISLGALPIAMSLGAASTSSGMGRYCGRNYLSLVLTLFVIPALYFMWSRAKNIILNLNTSKNMKMKVNKMNNYIQKV
jgi:multidrug efflux pump subunit AcrB